LLLIYASSINFIFTNEVKAQPQISIDVFYRELSPYGTWIQNNEYGYVWVPRHHDNFYPYSTGGYWLFTEYGWTWVSDYSWGWAPFHYGRWFYDPFYGWVWVPPRQEQQVPEKENPVIQPRQQEIPRQEIQQPVPRKENRPIIEAPSQQKPIQQRPPRQRINEVPENNYQQPVRKNEPEERPVLKQTLPTRKKPKMAD